MKDLKLSKHIINIITQLILTVGLVTLSIYLLLNGIGEF